MDGFDEPRFGEGELCLSCEYKGDGLCDGDGRYLCDIADLGNSPGEYRPCL
jgi:hypothetical protein